MKSNIDINKNLGMLGIATTTSTFFGGGSMHWLRLSRDSIITITFLVLIQSVRGKEKRQPKVSELEF